MMIDMCLQDPSFAFTCRKKALLHYTESDESVFRFLAPWLLRPALASAKCGIESAKYRARRFFVKINTRADVFDLEWCLAGSQAM